jgi:uncharacterized protein YndB with AHSA1/START domain
MPATRHETFTVPLSLPVPPPRVFAAFVEPALRRRWIRMPGARAEYVDDVRVGGTSTMRSVFPQPEGEERLANTETHLVVEPPRRLVSVYTASVGEQPRWTSLVTVELEPAGDGTALMWTEQVAFLVASERPEDDLAHLRGGIRLRLNGLAAATSG